MVLAKTLLHKPRVLILDEPASGLDPLARRELRQTLQQLGSSGATVLISSHILGELAEMCSSLALMQRGRLVATGPVEAIRQQLGRTERLLSITFLDGLKKAADWLMSHTAVHDLRIQEKGLVFGFRGSDEDQANLLQGLIAEGTRPLAFEEKRSSLEELFMETAEVEI